MTWREWFADLNWREAEHMRLNPENNQPLPPAFEMPVASKKFSMTLKESEGCPGAWCVWNDGVKINTFFGDNAYEDASKYLRGRLDENQ